MRPHLAITMGDPAGVGPEIIVKACLALKDRLASGDLRLETEVLALQHDFTARPSQVRFALRAYLAEEGTRRVVATRDFEAAQPSPGEDPYGGVQAANTAARVVLQKLAEFCAETAAQWQPVRRTAPAR